MPSTLFSAPIWTSASLEYWTYRVGAYLLLNFVDDPAWLAFIFC